MDSHRTGRWGRGATMIVVIVIRESRLSYAPDQEIAWTHTGREGGGGELL